MAFRFLSRQVDAEETASQTVFDIAFGVVLPALCFLADPLIFKSYRGWALFDRVALCAYLEALICMSLLLAFLWRRRPSPFITGGLMVGALYASAMALVLMPLSLLGIAVLRHVGVACVLGFLGLAPALSAFVYYRNTVRARRLFTREGRRPLVSAPTFCLLLLVLPLLAQKGANMLVNDCVDRILEGRASEMTFAFFEVLPRTHALDRIAAFYAREPRGPRREAIARDYLRITGESIEARLARLVD